MELARRWPYAQRMPAPASPSAKRKPTPPKVTPEKSETLKQLRANVGQLSTTTMRKLEQSLPGCSRLSADERSALGMVVQDQVPVIAPEADQPSLREAVLRYSREVAFAAADVYARAAESRGSWDTRLEALIVDAILRGENTDALRSRIAALGWKAQERFTVMVGNSPSEPSASYVSELRRMAGRYAEDALVGIQGDRLILILGGVQDRET